MRPVELLAALLAPDRCLHCRGPAPPDAPLCGGCRGALPWLAAVGGCGRCGLPEPCPAGRCPAATAPFSRAWAPLAHEGPARTLVVAAKERAAERVGRLLGSAIAARVPGALVADRPVVVAVPADPGRRRRRGVDHAAVLAGRVAELLELPLAAPLRRAPAPGRAAQHRLDRAARAGLAAPLVVGAAPRTVLLVDDVHTTGATLRAAAGALRRAGSVDVRAVTATRALGGARTPRGRAPGGRSRLSTTVDRHR